MIDWPSCFPTVPRQGHTGRKLTRACLEAASRGGKHSILHGCRLCVFIHDKEGRQGLGVQHYIFFNGIRICFSGLWEVQNEVLKMTLWLFPQPTGSIGPTAHACWLSVKSNQNSKQWNDPRKGIRRVVSLAPHSEEADCGIASLLFQMPLLPPAPYHTLSPAVRQNSDQRNSKV